MKARELVVEATRAECVAGAVEIARWLAAVAVEDSDSARWPSIPGVAVRVRPDCSLYYGAAGVILFLRELAAVTHDDAHLDLACRGARGLLRCARVRHDSLVWHLSWSEAAADFGLYLGGAGVAFALLELYKATRDPEWFDGAIGAARGVRNCASIVAGRRWNGANDIVSGAAGIGLSSLSIAAVTGDAIEMQHAVEAGEHLINAAVRENDGCWWPELIEGGAAEVRYPNFAHGTAGAAYFLAVLYETTRDSRYLEAAIGGARWLQASRRHGAKAAWHHHDPDATDLFYVGWCHGPAGTARLFYLLYVLTGEHEWKRLVQACAHWICGQRMFTSRSPGLWNLGMCCGLAGIGDFFASLYLALGEVNCRSLAARCAKYLLTAASPGNPGLNWIQAEHRVRPELRAAQTGYAQGAAGIGLFLLRVASCQVDDYRLCIRLPDDPFPRERLAVS